ncbi:NRDE-2, necessary for RNA interference-domain-containing protein [Ampelomyces quisqualis]|uniref:NRDE-2, necessary for RNA interference-domain-containing protein n=1 Tax=Ampelomyces quisqualis TaxID=50730 RepID=A0A6A5QJY1_AMPQU|nr:NRDE-2, necessary for RNA interference-domain-containing protein [Ampelomyces quisqualis]
MASNVPKFASFRPKPKAPAPTTSAEPRRSSHTVHETSQSREARKKDPSETELSGSSDVPKSNRGPVPSKQYFSDRRGDPEVLRYGTLNRSDVPSYRRFGNGFVLGLNRDQKIDRHQSSQTQVYITPATRRRQERLLTSKNVPKEGSRALRIILPNTRKTSTESEDFVHFSETRGSKLGDGEEDEEDTSEPDYHRFERDHDLPLDPDTEYDTEVKGIAIGSELIKENSELVRKTRDFPADLQAWLAFIEHQEAMMTLDHPTSDLNDAARQQLANVRIPIYEEALKKVPNDDENLITLYQGLLSEAQRSWNHTKLSSKWNEVLTKFPASTALWLMYLDVVQSNFAGFKYESCCAVYNRCLAAIQKCADGETILHVFIRMTSMIHGAGYQELALAIWQAILERSLSHSTSLIDLKDFEKFWDNEAPRIGEAGSSGWQKTAPAHDLPPPTVVTLFNPADSTFEDFHAREVDSINNLRYPGRTSDDVGDDDAFHTIFFADIEDYLRLIPTDLPTTLLVEAFLCFSGLPPPARVAGHQQMWWSDPFLSSVFIQTSPQARRALDPFGQKIESYLACETKSTQITSEMLFNHTFALGGARLSADFVRRILHLVTKDTLTDEIFGEYLLAFEARHFPSDVVKTAKQLLKTRPTSQRLYHAYGLVECQRGNLDKADQVFSIALSMGASGTYENLLLLHSWVWEAVDKPHGRVEALWRLTALSGKVPSRTDLTLLPDPAILNNTLESLSEACQKALLRKDYPCAVFGTSLLALLAYLPSDFDAELALSAHQSLTSYFRSHNLSASSYAELNVQAITRFLTYHTTHAPIVKPALIRTALQPLLTSFPNNTVLLSLYAANEARFAIDDRVRGIMHQNALQSSQARNVAGWSFAIHYETMRGQLAGSTSHSIRALYKRATHANASGAHSPALWAAYLRFELAQLLLQRAKTKGRAPGKDGKKRSWESRLEEAETRVKDAFYQGLRSLPWCKDFVMLAFTEARDVFAQEELWKVYRIMQEKELRVYVEYD